MKTLKLAAGLSAALWASTALAADSTVIPLYPQGVLTPQSPPERSAAPFPDGDRMIVNVSMPTLEVFRPRQGTSNGAAVIVAPGGGFVSLAYVKEGTAVAQRLAELGVTAFVLKYRLAPSPEDAKAGQAQVARILMPLITRKSQGSLQEVPRFAGEDLAAADGAQAVRLVRANAATWGVDPRRVGFVGFSAGAFTTVNVAIGDAATRPNFVGVIYGGLRSPVPHDAPPAFIATAADDQFFPEDGLRIYDAWKKAGVPAELHQYERGGHGFGMKPGKVTADHWFDEFVWWMEAHGYFKPA